MSSERNGPVSARPSPQKPEYLQLTYETRDSRRTINFPPPGLPKGACEAPPHGAGSYHDPEQHRILLDRVEALMCGKQP